MRKKILWVDGLGGLIVGVLVLAAGGWLSRLHRLPPEFLRLLAVVNLAYGTYSVSLASRQRRPRQMILLLAAANFFWMIMCLRWAWVYGDTASLFGMVHLLGEGFWVAGLAVLEYRWREDLLTA